MGSIVVNAEAHSEHGCGFGWRGSVSLEPQSASAAGQEVPATPGPRSNAGAVAPRNSAGSEHVLQLEGDGRLASTAPMKPASSSTETRLRRPGGDVFIMEPRTQ